jgi:hypothetical protein
MINKLRSKKVVYPSFLGGLVYYFYNKHMYEQEYNNRLIYLLENKVELSGVYVMQRQALSWLWYIQWLLPYHQSLKIVNKKTNTIRHVGLGGHKGRTSSYKNSYWF